MELTAAQVLRLNGDMKRDSPLMEAVRRVHALSRSRRLPYCIIGGMAVIRNGYARTTMDVDILTYRAEWTKLLPLSGDISSEGVDRCVDNPTGVRIDVLFADDDWGMVMPMPDPRRTSEFDEELGANFIDLHALVQPKAAVYLDKLREHGPATAAKDLADVQALMTNNLGKFSIEVIRNYDPRVRKHCMKIFREVERVAMGKKRRPEEIEL